jgi:hypothetical protein
MFRFRKSARARFQSTLYIKNNEPEPLCVWTEPWAVEFSIPPGETFRFVGLAQTAGTFEVQLDEKQVVLYGWESCTLKVYAGDCLVLDFPIPFPSLPEGMSMRGFVELLFTEQQEGQIHSGPCCDIWEERSTVR